MLFRRPRLSGHRSEQDFPRREETRPVEQEALDTLLTGSRAWMNDGSFPGSGSPDSAHSFHSEVLAESGCSGNPVAVLSPGRHSTFSVHGGTRVWALALCCGAILLTRLRLQSVALAPAELALHPGHPSWRRCCRNWIFANSSCSA